jgi:hypothetical protein
MAKEVFIVSDAKPMLMRSRYATTYRRKSKGMSRRRSLLVVLDPTSPAALAFPVAMITVTFAFDLTCTKPDAFRGIT